MRRCPSVGAVSSDSVCLTLWFSPFLPLVELLLLLRHLVHHLLRLIISLIFNLINFTLFPFDYDVVLARIVYTVAIRIWYVLRQLLWNYVCQLRLHRAHRSTQLLLLQFVLLPLLPLLLFLLYLQTLLQVNYVLVLRSMATASIHLLMPTIVPILVKILKARHAGVAFDNVL